MKRRSMVPLAIFAAASAGGAFAQTNAPAGHVILLATIKLKAGREQDFLKLLAEMAARVKKEDTGNIRYELFSVAPGRGAQTGAAPTYIFYEEWQDQASSAAHGKWAGPIVQMQWREMSESVEFQRLSIVHPE